jgi:hypothetical protein
MLWKKDRGTHVQVIPFHVPKKTVSIKTTYTFSCEWYSAVPFKVTVDLNQHRQAFLQQRSHEKNEETWREAQKLAAARIRRFHGE